MFSSLHNSWELFKTTLGVLRQDKELLVFPLLSGVALLVVLASFAGGLFGAGYLQPGFLDKLDGEQALTRAEQVGLYAFAFAFYFINYLVITYFNAALVGAAMIRLDGGDPGVGDGIAAANRRLGVIIGFSAIAATVGMILKLIESRSEMVGRFVAGLLGMAWSLVTYLVVPVIVMEHGSAIHSIKRSGGLLRDTWGEQLVAHFGFGLFGFLLSLLGFVLIGAGIAAAVWVDAGVWLVVAAVGLGVLYLVVLSLVLSALKGIYAAALYAHATQRNVRGFPAHLLQEAFGPRQR